MSVTSALPRPGSAGLRSMAPLQVPRALSCRNPPRREPRAAWCGYPPWLSVSGSDKCTVRWEPTSKALGKLKILSGGYEH